MTSIHPNYPNKRNPTHWERARYVEYPVRRFPGTEVSSKERGHGHRGNFEVLRSSRPLDEEIRFHNFDYETRRHLVQSQTTVDFAQKHPDTYRHNKHTSCSDNQYVYHTSRRLESVPALHVHPTSEHRRAYRPPATAPHLVTRKDQFKRHFLKEQYVSPQEPSFVKPLPSLDTTYEGFEKLLDPYLTTSRLHHRPYTADQLARPAAVDAVTYYTYSDVPWVRRPKPNAGEWILPLKMPGPMRDREQFKHPTREIRTHNKLSWVPGSFRTEFLDNFESPKAMSQVSIAPNSQESEVKAFYDSSLAEMPTNNPGEEWAIRSQYTTENSEVGSRTPICATIRQHVEKNRRLQLK